MQRLIPLILILLVLPMTTQASCGVQDAKIVDLYQYFDGHVFVNFDKSTDCNCSQTGRLAFKVTDEDTKFIQSMILMAYASGRKVNAVSSSEICSVHSNTPIMDYFRVHPE